MCDKDRVDVSVIVPTRNRSSRLATLLDDLSHQRTGCTFEVIVVDNASVDDTGRVVERWRAQDRRIHYLLEPRRGASRARNAGIAAATAPILAFIDDDVRPTPDWIASLHRAFELHPDLDCLGGRIEPRWPVPPPSWLTSAHWGPLALQMGRGASHARMRYRDTITRDGVLDDAMTSGGWAFGGVPGFLLREWMTHAREWVRKIWTRQFDLAFFDECRLRYLSSYMATRWRAWTLESARAMGRTAQTTHQRMMNIR